MLQGLLKELLNSQKVNKVELATYMFLTVHCLHLIDQVLGDAVLLLSRDPRVLQRVLRRVAKRAIDSHKPF